MSICLVRRHVEGARGVSIKGRRCDRPNSISVRQGNRRRAAYGEVRSHRQSGAAPKLSLLRPTRNLPRGEVRPSSGSGLRGCTDPGGAGRAGGCWAGPLRVRPACAAPPDETARSLAEPNRAAGPRREVEGRGGRGRGRGRRSVGSAAARGQASPPRSALRARHATRSRGSPQPGSARRAQSVVVRDPRRRLVGETLIGGHCVVTEPAHPAQPASAASS